MGWRINTAARNAGLDAILGLINGGSGAGVLRIYSGTAPAGPGTAVTSQTLLAEFDLSDPAFPSGSGGSAAIDTSPALTTTGLAAGTATWCRFCDSTEAAGTGLGVLDGDVTATGGGGELTMNTTTISVGLDVEVTGGSITMPAGT
jgi:hypothetical protein